MPGSKPKPGSGPYAGEQRYWAGEEASSSSDPFTLILDQGRGANSFPLGSGSRWTKATRPGGASCWARHGSGSSLAKQGNEPAGWAAFIFSSCRGQSCTPRSNHSCDSCICKFSVV
ncbi:hypothetical protein Droror1_Dr00011423 [Drosera rotundifolia]